MARHALPRDEGQAPKHTHLKWRRKGDPNRENTKPLTPAEKKRKHRADYNRIKQKEKREAKKKQKREAKKKQKRDAQQLSAKQPAADSVAVNNGTRNINVNMHMAETDSKSNGTRNINVNTCMAETDSTRKINVNTCMAETDSKSNGTRNVDKHMAETDSKSNGTRNINKHVAETDSRSNGTRNIYTHMAETDSRSNGTRNINTDMAETDCGNGTRNINMDMAETNDSDAETDELHIFVGSLGSIKYRFKPDDLDGYTRDCAPEEYELAIMELEEDVSAEPADYLDLGLDMVDGYIVDTEETLEIDREAGDVHWTDVFDKERSTETAPGNTNASKVGSSSVNFSENSTMHNILPACPLQKTTKMHIPNPLRVPVNTQEPKEKWASYTCNKLLHVHKLAVGTKSHHLAQSSSTKDWVRGPSDEKSLVESSIDFPITGRLFCVFMDLHKHPHGSMKEVDAPSIREELRRHGNSKTRREGKGHCEVVALDKNQRRHVNDDRVRVVFPGDPILLAFEELGISHLDMLLWVLKHGEGSTKRDHNSGADSVSRRIVTGWTPIQENKDTPAKKKKPKTQRLGRKFLPCASFEEGGCEHWRLPGTGDSNFDMNKIKMQLGRIMHLAQMHVDLLCKDKNPYSNKLRTRFFGERFCRTFWADCAARFEYLDIFVEKGSDLNRHIDYKNCCKAGYEVGASHSYLIEHPDEQPDEDGKRPVYRVNFIMCSRKVCGDFMDKIEGDEGVHEEMEIVLTPFAPTKNKPASKTTSKTTKKAATTKTKKAKPRNPVSRKKGN